MHKPKPMASKHHLNSLSLLVVFVTAVLLLACAPTTDSPEADAPATDNAATDTTTAAKTEEGLQLTLDELKAYNGKNGQPAYVAFEGIIYDVSSVPQWADGEHNGITAGVDITKLIEKSPHGPKNLKLATPVGSIVE